MSTGYHIRWTKLKLQLEGVAESTFCSTFGKNQIGHGIHEKTGLGIGRGKQLTAFILHVLEKLGADVE